MEKPKLIDDVWRRILPECDATTRYHFSQASKGCNILFHEFYSHQKWIDAIQIRRVAEGQFMLEVVARSEKEVERELYKLGSHARYGPVEQMQYVFGRFTGLGFLVDLRKLVGPSLRSVILKNLLHQEANLIDKVLLRGVTIKHLHIQLGELTEHDSVRIEECVEKNRVESLKISSCMVQPTQRPFLLHLAGTLRTIVVHQMASYAFLNKKKRARHLDRFSSNLFGITNIDWVDVVSAMIDQGVRDVQLINELNHPAHVSEARRLVEVLEQIEKPFTVTSTFGVDLAGVVFPSGAHMTVNWRPDSVIEHYRNAHVLAIASSGKPKNEELHAIVEMPCMVEPNVEPNYQEMNALRFDVSSLNESLFIMGVIIAVLLLLVALFF